MQDRLDEGVVNAKSFGIVSSTTLDQTDIIQTAFTEIATKTNVTLEFDPGTYLFSETVTLPTNLKISGFGKDQTIFKFTGTGIAFATSTLPSPNISSRQTLKDFSIKLSNNSSTCLKVNNSKYIEVENVKFSLDGVASDHVPTLANQVIGIDILGNGSVSSNKFKGLEFKHLTYAVYGGSNMSSNNFDNCLLEFLYQGFVLGFSVTPGASYNTISNCIFDKITRQGIYIYNGTGNISRGNTFKDVGAFNEGGSSRYSIITFESDGNNSVRDIFERYTSLEQNKPYYPHIDGIGNSENFAPTRITLQTSPTSIKAFRFPLNDATAIQVNYVYKSNVNNQIRTGSLTLAVDKIANKVQLIDDYEFIGTDPDSDDKLLFSAVLETETDGFFSATHVAIYYTNINAIDSNNTFTYTYFTLS